MPTVDSSEKDISSLGTCRPNALAKSDDGENPCAAAVRSLHNRAWDAYRLNLPRATALAEKARSILGRQEFDTTDRDLRAENLAIRALCAVYEQERSATADSELPRALSDAASAALTGSSPALIDARVRYAASEIAIGLCEFDRAEILLRSIIDLLPAGDDPRVIVGLAAETRLRIDAISDIGLVQHRRGEFVEALETQSSAYQLATQPAQQMRAIGQIRTMGHADVSTHSGYRYAEAISLNRLGMLHERLGDFTAAIDAHQRCLPLRQELGDRHGEACTLNNLANAYLQVNNIDTALEVYQRALELCREIGFSGQEAGILVNMGLACAELVRMDEAVAFTASALELNRRMKDRRSEANTLGNLGRALLASGRFAEGQSCLESALQLDREFGDHHGIAGCLTALGRLFSELHDPETGALLPADAYEPVLDEALNEATQTGSLELMLAVHATFVDAYKRRGEFELALGHSERYSAGKDALFKTQTAEQVRMLQHIHEAEQSRKEAEIHRLRSVELAAALREAQTQRHLAERLANEDALTGLTSRRLGDLRLSSAFEKSLETGDPMSIVLADADHFKAINDRFSHLTGDSVLRQLARICLENLRTGDIAVRFGGEELLFILPGTDLKNALAWSETLRNAVESYAWEQIHPELCVRLSLGVTTRSASAPRINPPKLEAQAHAVETLVRAADARLYEAKAAGRNCVRS